MGTSSSHTVCDRTLACLTEAEVENNKSKCLGKEGKKVLSY